jgi:hypothetical protein
LIFADFRFISPFFAAFAAGCFRYAIAAPMPRERRCLLQPRV